MMRPQQRKEASHMANDIFQRREIKFLVDSRQRAYLE